MDARSCVTRMRVRFGETDAAGIVFYPTVYVWFDVGTHALLRAAVGALHDDDGRPLWPLAIVDSGASFLAPLAFDDEIEIHSTVAAVGVRSVRIEHVIRHGEVEIAHGFEARVLVRHEGTGIVAQTLPEVLRKGLSEFVATKGWA